MELLFFRCFSSVKQWLIMLLLFSFASATAQNGTVQETGLVKSKLLQKDVRYSVYLPHNYHTAQRSYPVLYLLHGYGDDHTGWVQFGEIAHYADEAIASGSATPMIIVMPDGFKSYYINSYDSATRYEDFFFQELMPAVEQQLRIRRDRSYRAVGGLSMGGYGAFVYALKRPDLFGAATLLSAAVRTDEQLISMNDEQYNATHGPLYGRGLKGAQRLSEVWYANSVLKLIESGQAARLKAVRWYIDCGDDDYLSVGNMAVHAALKKREVPHEFRMRDGAHNWTYWRSALPDVLNFVSTLFHK